jgi:hypothetical protein
MELIWSKYFFSLSILLILIYVGLEHTYLIDSFYII